MTKLGKAWLVGEARFYVAYRDEVSVFPETAFLQFSEVKDRDDIPLLL